MSRPMTDGRLREIEQSAYGDSFAIRAELIADIRRLRARETELLAANTAEVERRRKAEAQLRGCRSCRRELAARPYQGNGGS
jgi:hypothetical protein